MGGLSIFAHTDASVAPEATNVAILEPGSVPATPPGLFPTASFVAAMFAPGSDTISKALGNSKEVADKHYLKPDGVLPDVRKAVNAVSRGLA